MTLLAEMKIDATVIIAFRAFQKQVRSSKYGLDELCLPVFSDDLSKCCFSRWMQSYDQSREPPIPTVAGSASNSYVSS